MANVIAQRQRSERQNIGLTHEEAARLLEAEGENRFAAKKKISPVRIFAGQFHDVMVLILLIAVIVIPHYFLHAKVIITKNEIATSGGFIFLKNDYMPISSIKSISVIITPLGRFTGFNFAVINALGARILICFMRKSDLTEIAETINALIRSREEPQETQRRAQKTRSQPQKRADDHNHEHEQTTNNENKKSGGAGAV